MSPKDERYKHLVGRYARHPFLDRLMPIFADDHVDPEFGTGVSIFGPLIDPFVLFSESQNMFGVFSIEKHVTHLSLHPR